MYAHCLNKRMFCSVNNYKQGTRHNSDKSAIFDKTLLKKWLTDIIKYSNRIIRERNRQNTTELSTCSVSEYL